MGVSHGEPCVTLGAAAQAVGRSVRVTGRLASFNPQEARALIKHRGEELWIDTSFLTGSRLQEAELLQFIGEAFAGGAGGPPGEPDTYVRARVVRNVENLDLEMYERAVLATRQFLVDGTSSSALAIPARQRPTAEHWGCDPVWKSSAKLLAAQLAALPWAAETAGSRDLVCWLGSHPVRHVDVMGVVVSLDPRAPREADERVSLTLDDGGGLVECVWWATGAAAAHRAQLLGALRLGALLHVLGRLGQFREQMQLTIDHAWLEVDPMAEPAHWLRARELWRTVYAQPFRIPPGLAAPAGGAPGGGAPRGAPAGAPAAPPHSDVALLGRVLEQARMLCGGGRLSTDAAELARALRASASPGAERATAPQVQRAIDELVQQSALYVVSDGPGAGQRTVRPT